MLSQNNGNEYNTTNIWWFGKIVLWIVDIFMEHGIDVEIVPEDYTSKKFSQYMEINIKTEENIEDYIYAGRLGRRSMRILMHH
jgi:hypothetical protein